MSLSGGVGPAYGKLGEDALHYGDESQGPKPTAENPAGVYPASSPHPSDQQRRQGGVSEIAHGSASSSASPVPGSGSSVDREHDPRAVFSNPAMFSEQMKKLSTALTDAIYAIEDESGSGIGGTGRELIQKFKTWRNEVDLMRAGKSVDAAEDDGPVQRTGEGGLYTD